MICWYTSTRLHGITCKKIVIITVYHHGNKNVLIDTQGIIRTNNMTDQIASIFLIMLQFWWDMSNM
jgi:hypothetical protein